MNMDELRIILKKRIERLEKDWNKAVLDGSSKDLIEYINGRWHEAEHILDLIQCGF